MSSRMLPGSLPTAIALLALFSAAIVTSSAVAQDETAETPDPRPLKEQWQDLFAQRQSLVEKIVALRKEFQTADEDRKEKIRQEFRGIVAELEQRVMPKLGKIAAKVFADDPKNVEAGETAIQDALHHNRFEEIARLADPVLEAGGDERDNTILLNLKGFAAFALHDFAKAAEIYKALDAEGKLHREYGVGYLEPSEQYQEFWVEEQALRKKEAAAKGDQLLPRVLFKTNKGEIELELFENEAPNTVANFISLVEAKKYDGIKFHRVIPNFMAQGGDPNTLDDDPTNDGQGGPGYTIPCECFGKKMRRHFRGSISMAHAGKDTGGSQFFITHLPTPHLNANPDEQTGHTVFGRVVEGMDVVDSLQVGDEIESATVVRKRNHKYEPKTQPE